MRLERHVRCVNCKDAATAGCREVCRTVTEVERVLAEGTARALRHDVQLPQVEFHVDLPCWYSARKWEREH